MNFQILGERNLDIISFIKLAFSTALSVHGSQLNWLLGPHELPVKVHVDLTERLLVILVPQRVIIVVQHPDVGVSEGLGAGGAGATDLTIVYLWGFLQIASASSRRYVGGLTEV